MTITKALSGARTRRDILKGASVLGGGVLAAPFCVSACNFDPVSGAIGIQF